jgi:hypothetical protein
MVLKSLLSAGFYDASGDGSRQPDVGTGSAQAPFGLRKLYRYGTRI